MLAKWTQLCYERISACQPHCLKTLDLLISLCTHTVYLQCDDPSAIYMQHQSKLKQSSL